MTVGFIDATVIVHLFRKDQAAINWIDKQPSLAVSVIAWLEMLDGCSNKQIL
jgi:predicted nucleic acid-binding protein